MTAAVNSLGTLGLISSGPKDSWMFGPQVVQNLICHGSVGWEGECGTEEAMAVPTSPKQSKDEGCA